MNSKQIEVKVPAGAPVTYTVTVNSPEHMKEEAVQMLRRMAGRELNLIKTKFLKRDIDMLNHRASAFNDAAAFLENVKFDRDRTDGTRLVALSRDELALLIDCCAKRYDHAWKCGMDLDAKAKQLEEKLSTYLGSGTPITSEEHLNEMARENVPVREV